MHRKGTFQTTTTTTISLALSSSDELVRGTAFGSIPIESIKEKKTGGEKKNEVLKKKRGTKSTINPDPIPTINPIFTNLI